MKKYKFKGSDGKVIISEDAKEDIKEGMNWTEEEFIKNTELCNIVSIQLNLSDKALSELNELKSKVNAETYTEVIKRSLKIFRFLHEEKEKGSTIIVESSNGKQKELIL